MKPTTRKRPRQRTPGPLALLAISLCLASATPAQEPPRLRPGELALDTSVLRPINVLTRRELEKDGEPASAPMMLEYDRLLRQGRIIGQIRWLSSFGEWPAYDLMFVDQETFRIRVRHEPLPEGGLLVKNWHDDRVTAMTLPLRGEPEYFDHPVEGPFSDIATFPLLFAAMPWEDHEELVIPLGDYKTGETDWAHLRNLGRTSFTGTRGDEHRVWRIRYLDFDPEQGRTIDYYVTSEPPYWVGMELRAKDGEVTTTVRVQDHQVRDPSMGQEVEALRPAGEPGVASRRDGGG